MKKSMIKGLVLAIGASFAAGIVFADQQQVSFGCVVRLKHAATGRYLSADDERYDHAEGSGQYAVYGSADKDNDTRAHWIITGGHNGARWNSDLTSALNTRSMWGSPLRVNKTIRLESVKTKRKLHGHDFISPITRQKEVTNYKEFVGDTNDDFVIELVEKAGVDYVTEGLKFKLKHKNTGMALHSHSSKWKDDKQEVTLYWGRDDNDYWVPEIVKQPYDNPVIKDDFEFSRNVNINYLTPIMIDSDTYDLGPLSSRVWTHAGSIYGNINSPIPHDHMEVLVGANNGDARPSRGPALFYLENVDDKLKTGPVSWGDKVRIVATWSGAGERDGLLAPFRYLWVHEYSRWGSGYRDIVVSRFMHPQASGSAGVFTLKPFMDGQRGPITTNDLVLIKNLSAQDKVERSLWSHSSSRFGGRWFEILISGGDDDKWGNANVGRYRDRIYDKFKFSLALKESMGDQTGRDQLVQVTKEIEPILGAAASQQRALAAEALAKQKELEKQEAEKREAAAAAESARLKEAAEKAAQEADAKLAAEVEAAKQLQADLEAEKEARAEAEKAAAANVDAAKQEAVQQAQRAAAIAEDMERMQNLPVGFVKLPGLGGRLVSGIALGLQDSVVEAVVDNKGTKSKVVNYNDLALVVLDDGTLVQRNPNRTAGSPWIKVPLNDAGGKKLKVSQAAVGMDGTTVVIGKDGKSFYMIGWAGDTAPAMPQPSRGFEAADKKAAVHEKVKAKRKKNKKGKKAKKNKKGKSKKKIAKKANVAPSA